MSIQKQFDEYLKENFRKGVIDHAIRVNVDEKGKVSFYIHARDVSSETLDFEVYGNLLTEAGAIPQKR